MENKNNQITSGSGKTGELETSGIFAELSEKKIIEIGDPIVLIGI